MNSFVGSKGSAIVVGTDGSPTAGRAVDCAASLGRKLDAVIHLVTAYKPHTAGAFTLAPPHDPRATAEEILAEAADRIREAHAEVRTHAVKGAAADALVEIAEAETAKMILVGSKGMSSSRRYVLGNVPNRVSHHAPCSVLIVRTGDDALCATP